MDKSAILILMGAAIVVYLAWRWCQSPQVPDNIAPVIAGVATMANNQAQTGVIRG